MKWLRRALLELWAMSVLAIVVGFLGPFGTYLGTSMVERVQVWARLLMGAYLIVRPCIWAFRRIADATALPARALTFWGVAATSLPLAMLWRAVGQDAYRELEGYVELVPFALLCALAVLAVAWWAETADRHLRAYQSLGPPGMPAGGERVRPDAPELPAGGALTDPAGVEPPLHARLAPGFRGPVIALQSEDHYVRVHGAEGSELLLMRLRDAITELGDVPGEQVHRSWWIARDGIAGLERAGRTWSVRLKNGELAPVARESVYRLRQSGFLPGDAVEDSG